MNDKKRAILLKGGDSKPYEQAIFIVRGEFSKISRDVVAEAEKIVGDYLNGGDSGVTAVTAPPAKLRRKGGGLDIFFSGAALLACIALFALVLYTRFL